MKIAIGCDHMGYDTKRYIIRFLLDNGHEVYDCGTHNRAVRTHYPIYGRELSLLVVKKKVDIGIAICGTGVGISNSCNKVSGINCMLVSDPIVAEIARSHFNVNVISFGGLVVGMNLGRDIVEAFIKTKPGYTSKKEEEWIKEVNKLLPTLNDNPRLFDKINEKWQAGFYTNKELQLPPILPIIKKLSLKSELEE